jgi:tetratricopeptide (TPR) repeat protein
VLPAPFRLAFAALLALGLLFAAPAAAQDAATLARAQELFTQGVAAYQAGRFDEAARLLREADRLVPTPELAFNLARVYERMGEAPEAIRHFERYLREGRPSAEERADIERRIAAMRNLERRMREQVMTTSPTGDEMTEAARTFFERGVVMFRRRRYDAALQAFTAAYNFARLPEVIYNLAVTSERTGRLQDAIDYYREYLRARPDDPGRRPIERRIEELRAAQQRRPRR